jgi:hypothetical protein
MTHTKKGKIMTQKSGPDVEFSVSLLLCSVVVIGVVFCSSNSSSSNELRMRLVYLNAWFCVMCVVKFLQHACYIQWSLVCFVFVF